MKKKSISKGGIGLGVAALIAGAAYIVGSKSGQRKGELKATKENIEKKNK